MSQLNKNSEELQFELMTQCGIDLHLTYTNLTQGLLYTITFLSSTPSRRRDVSASGSQPQPLTSHSLSTSQVSSHRPQVLYTIYSWAPKPEPVSSIHACQPEM